MIRVADRAPLMTINSPAIAAVYGLRTNPIIGLVPRRGPARVTGDISIDKVRIDGPVCQAVGPSRRRVFVLSALLSMAWPETQAAPIVLELPPIDIVAASPLLGSGVDRDKVPAATHVFRSGDMARTGAGSLAGALDAAVGGVALNEAAANPFQPNLVYRGFVASPLDGSAQGIAVYVNGARFNQPFGDTVNWDLFPDIAIDRIELEGANPVFGLNALGGSLSVELKNGFTYTGGEAIVSGGSFGRAQAQFQVGTQSRGVAAYVAGNLLRDGGWRKDQSSELRQIYGDLGWRGKGAELHLNLIAANNRLNGPGTIPVELLSADRTAQFTAPNAIANSYLRLSLTGNIALSDTTSVQTVAYFSYFRQLVNNGNVPNFAVCDDGSGFLCARGAVLTGRGGQPIPDYLKGGPYAQLDRQAVNTNGYGLSAQLANTDALFGLTNHVVAGVSVDGGITTFTASSQVGALSPDRSFLGPGTVIDQADGSSAPVRVSVANRYYGLYATDILDLTPSLSLNLSGRLNFAQTGLDDQLGTALTGRHAYLHFNPGIGLTYKIAPWIGAYASYALANRAPTPAELSCANIASPCTLANFFAGDPDLKLVVSQTIEIGLRGKITPYKGCIRPSRGEAAVTPGWLAAADLPWSD